MEKQEMQERQIARLKTIGKLELEKTELLSQMVFANAEEYNHLNIALNALGVATDHLEIVAEDAKEKLNALKEKEYLAERTDALLAEVEEHNYAKESGDVDNSREDEAREIKTRGY